MPLDSVPPLLYVLGFYFYLFIYLFCLPIWEFLLSSHLAHWLFHWLCAGLERLPKTFLLFFTEILISIIFFCFFMCLCFLFNQQSYKICLVSLISQTKKKLHSLTKARDLHFGLLCCKAATPSTSPRCVPWSVWVVHRSSTVQTAAGETINRIKGGLPLLSYGMLYHIFLASCISPLSYDHRWHYK